MFDINYNHQKITIYHWLETSVNHFLLMDGEGQLYDSDELQGEDYRKILEEKAKETEQSCSLSDYHHLKIEALDFFDLVDVYRDSKDEQLRLQLQKTMAKALYEYENQGRELEQDDVSFFVRMAASLEVSKEDEGIEEYIEEFRIFLKLKVYEQMTLYELLNEKERFLEVLEEKRTASSLGFPFASAEEIRHRFLPALRVLIALKEDIYLLELLGLYRDYEKINPFTVTDRTLEKTKKSPFYYFEKGIFLYDYSFFENLGIDTLFLEEELREILPWQYKYMCEYLHGLSAEALQHIRHYRTFYEKLRYVQDVYADSNFVHSFLTFLYARLQG